MMVHGALVVVGKWRGAIECHVELIKSAGECNDARKASSPVNIISRAQGAQVRRYSKGIDGVEVNDI